MLAAIEIIHVEPNQTENNTHLLRIQVYIIILLHLQVSRKLVQL